MGWSPGPYQLIDFDTDGDGFWSRAFRMSPNSGTPDGIQQDVQLQGGVTYRLDLDVALSTTPSAIVARAARGCWLGRAWWQR